MAPPAPEAATPLIAFDRVSRTYGSFTLALSEVSFQLLRGQFAVLRGPHGAGKTTLLRLTAGLEPASNGSIRIAGQDLAALGPRALAGLRRSIGIVPRDRLLLDDRSVLDNVMLPARVAGLWTSEARERACAALARVGLDPADAARRRPAVFGSGDRERIALARALVNRPALLLIDEPTATLDRATAVALLALLGGFAAAGVAVLAASRDDRELWPSGVLRWPLSGGRLGGIPAPETVK
jgi:cell division transport system ATP-binding protein